MRANIRSIKRLIRNNWKRLFLLEIIYKLFFFALIIPFISLCYNTALKFTKYSYITTENITRFILYPQTILATIIILIVLALFVVMESASLFYFFEDCKNQKKQYIPQLIIAGVRNMCSMIRRRLFIEAFYVLFISAILNVPLIVVMIMQAGIPSYLVRAFFRLDYSKYIVITIMMFLIFIFCRYLFLLPISILDKKSYREAKRTSLAYIKESNYIIIAQFVGVNIGLIMIYVIVYIVCIGLLILVINIASDTRIAIPLFLQNHEQLARIIFVCASILATIANYALISNLYVRVSKPEIKELEESYDQQRKKPKIRLESNIKKQLKRVLIVISCLCALTVYSYFYNTLRNGNFRAEESLLGLQITAHRGDSNLAPENTLAAVESAIESFSDYAEIDVQLTKDGKVVLCHDSNLYRTSKARVKVADLTYQELLEYDVGAWFSKDYVGTKIPSLREVLEISKGNIKLNIELKRIDNQRELVEKVIDLIEEYEFERQCVITSMSYEALAMVKERNVDIKTGYIMSLAYGNFYENDNIDFFSMKASIVTENMVKKAHTLGKEVHVWTVNSRNEITRLAALGVDNIITDEPMYAKNVLYDVENTTLLQYLRMLMK